MGVDHCRTHIRVPKEFPRRPDVVPGLQQVCREAVPQRVGVSRGSYRTLLVFLFKKSIKMNCPNVIVLVK